MSQEQIPSEEQDRLNQSRLQSDAELLQGGAVLRPNDDQIAKIKLEQEQRLAASRADIDRLTTEPTPETQNPRQLTPDYISEHLFVKPDRELTPLELQAIELGVACADYGDYHYARAGSVTGRRNTGPWETQRGWLASRHTKEFLGRSAPVTLRHFGKIIAWQANIGNVARSAFEDDLEIPMPPFDTTQLRYPVAAGRELTDLQHGQANLGVAALRELDNMDESTPENYRNAVTRLLDDTAADLGRNLPVEGRQGGTRAEHRSPKQAWMANLQSAYEREKQTEPAAHGRLDETREGE